jgi:threonine aldolase
MTLAQKKNFASDNVAPVCPELMAALTAENNGPAFGYGNDPTTERMERNLRDLFGCSLRAFPVATGTSANVLGLSVLTPPYGSIYCHDLSHIEVDECGAPEFYTAGAKLVLQPGANGKMAVKDVAANLEKSGAGVVHHVQPAVVNLTQVTDCGTVYTADEVSEFGELCRNHNLALHMDGARFANAVSALGCEPADITWKAGVDVLSFGVTKNGGMAVEAVIIFDEKKAQEFEFRRKRGAHLFSKMRYLSAQLARYTEDGLWLDLASNANEMARRLSDGLLKISGVRVEYPVDANMIFAFLSEKTIEQLEKSDFMFYVMGPRNEARVRLVTSWNTTAQEVDQFLDIVRAEMV